MTSPAPPSAPSTPSPTDPQSGDGSISPLRFRNFRFFWLARFASVIATNGMVVIIGYQLYDVARAQYGMTIAQAAFQLGLLGLVQFLPLFCSRRSPVSLPTDMIGAGLPACANGLDLVVALWPGAADKHRRCTACRCLFALGRHARRRARLRAPGDVRDCAKCRACCR